MTIKITDEMWEAAAAAYDREGQHSPGLTAALQAALATLEPKNISDGFHTMEELYEHRRALTAALATTLHKPWAWKSKEHHPEDGPMFEGGYFIVGIDLPTGTITYHYKLSHWDDFQEVRTLPHAPKWDGAGPDATVERLLAWARA
jgi:hypothetical protein